MLNLLSLQRKNSCCLAVDDGVGGVSTGQILTDVTPEDPEAADSLYCSPIDGDGGVPFSLSLPVVHNQLLSITDDDMEVVVLAPRCQGSDLLSVGHLVVDQADDGRVVSEHYDVLELCETMQSFVTRDYRRGRSTQPWGAPVLRVRVEDVVETHFLGQGQ